MIRAIFFLLYFLGTYANLQAQMGNLLVKNYRLPTNPQVNEIVQSKQGIIYFAHSEGILSYDGLRWDNLNINYSPRCLWIDAQDNLWVGGKEFIGKLTIDITGKLNFERIKIPIEKEIGDVISLAAFADAIYFYSEKAIIQYKNNEVKIIHYQEEQEMQGWLLHQGNIFINTPDKGLCKLNGTSLQVIQNDFSDKVIHNFVPFDEKNILLSTSDNQLWLFDGKITPYSTYASQYLQENFLEKVANVSDSELAISTLAGGVLIINKKDRSIRHIINYETGLADNESSAIFTDQQKGIWVCHSEGISRIALHLPVYNISHYPGLEGKPYTVSKVKNLLYVATNSGLFYLSASNKDDVSGKVAQEKQRQMQQIAWQNARLKAQKKKLKLRNVVDKVNPLKKAEEPKEKAPKVVTVVVEANVYDYNYSNYIIEKIPYNFRKIAGIDSKCKQLVPFQGRLIALTNTGLYEVLYGIASSIVEDRNIQYAEVSKQNPNILYIATNKGAFWLQKTAEGWSKPNYIAAIQGICFSLCQKDKNIWFTGEGKVWKAYISPQGSPTKVAKYTIEANSTMRIVAREVNGDLLFFTPKTVFIHKPLLIGDAFLPAKDWLSYGLNLTRLYINQSSYTWINQETTWEALGKSKSTLSKYLSTLPEVQDVYQDENNLLWVATPQGIFLVKPQSSEKKDEKRLTTFVKKIQNGEGKILDLKKTSIESQGNAQNFSLQIAAPFFIAEENTQFQYLLKGLDDGEWSAWRKQANIDFPYLPSGNYELLIRAKNALGELSDTEVFAFEVAAPFWETWWFYLMQIGILFGLLLAAVIYNRRGAESKVASVITLVALITIFEFIILLLEPIIDDFVGGVFIFKLVMNILLAISLIPLEKRIRTYLQNSEHLDALAQKIGFRKKMQDIKDYMGNIKDLARNRRQE